MMKHVLLIGRVAILAVLLFACGDDGNQQPNPMPTCTGTGVTCALDEDCCTGTCDDLTGLCARVPGQCLAAEAECLSGPDCCSFACVDFRCSGDQCTGDAAACDTDTECCSGLCDAAAGTCTPLNLECRTSGNT